MTPAAGASSPLAAGWLPAGTLEEVTPAGSPATVWDLFAGPGGWDTAAAALGLPRVIGVEADAAACATREAAGHATIRADITRLRPSGRLAGLIASPPCITFSAAGKRAGAGITAELGDLILDALAGQATRAWHRRRMAATLRAAWWPDPKLTRAERGRRIWAAVRSAALVAEPARFIHACRPGWVAMEQVPGVLPLWRVYAAGLAGLGYRVWAGKLNAADYGVPQTRTRAILIASRTRRVRRPGPTHYDPRKGDQLWGERWVSMAQALGWGATGRPAPTTTAGGVATGGAEPFGHRDRDALDREQAAGRWALRADAQDHAAVRDVTAPAPAPALKFGHAAGDCQWVLRPSFSDTGYRKPREREAEAEAEAAPTVNSKTRNWDWKLRNNNNNNNACERSPDEPAGTLFFGHRSNWAAWVADRPSTTVQGDPRIGRPGHKDRDKGESMFAQESVRITVEEAAILQSFVPGYPWHGTKNKQFEQVGNAVPPLLALHVLAMATGLEVT